MLPPSKSQLIFILSCFLLFSCSPSGDELVDQANKMIMQISFAEFEDNYDETRDLYAEYDKVVTFLDEGLLKYPDNMKLLELRVGVHAGLGNLELARKDVERMITLDRKHVGAHSMLCAIDKELGVEPARVEQCFRDTAKLIREQHRFKANGDPREGGYIAYLLLGKDPKAATLRDAYLQKLQEHDPSSVWMYEMMFEKATDGTLTYGFGEPRAPVNK